MSTVVQSLISNLMALGDTERQEIADLLYESLPDQEFSEEFLAEINRRSDEIDAGTAKGRTLEEVMFDLKGRFG